MERVFSGTTLAHIVAWLDNRDRWALDVVLQHSKRAAFPRIDHVPLTRVGAFEQLSDCLASGGRCCRRWLQTLVPATVQVDILLTLLLKLLADDRLALAQRVHAAMSDGQRQTLATDVNIFNYAACINGYPSYNNDCIERIYTRSLETIKYFWTHVCTERHRREMLQGDDVLSDRFLVELMLYSCAPFTTVEWFLGGDATFARVHGARPSNTRLFALAFAGGRTATIEYYWRRLSEQERYALTVHDLTLTYSFDNEFFDGALIFPLLKEIGAYVPVPAVVLNRLYGVSDDDAAAFLALFSLFEELSARWKDKEYLRQLVEVLDNECYDDALRSSLYARLVRRIAR